MDEKLLSLKQMCERFEVTPRTLRHYEYVELLTPQRVGRARHYGPREVARMTLILRGRRFGFSLEEIRQWLALYDEAGSAAQNAAFVALADRQIETLTQQRDALEQTIAELRETRDQVSRM